MKTLILKSLLLCFIFSSALAKQKSFHFLDSAVLSSIKDPATLTTLAEFEELVQALPIVTEQMYGTQASKQEWIKKYVFPQTSLLEVAPKDCLSNPRSWKLIGYRLHPFASMQLGDQKLAGAGLAQIRLTFQPICSFDEKNKTGLAEDNAIHVVYQVFQKEEDSLKHFDLRQQYETAILNTDLSQIRSTQKKYESFLTHPQRKKDQLLVINLIRQLRALRTDTSVDLSAFEKEKSSLMSIKGETIQTNDTMQSLVHPLLQKNAEGMHRILNEVRRLTHQKSIWQIRSQTAGFGQLHWLFSNTEWNPLDHKWNQQPVVIYETDKKTKTSKVLMNIGWYDFLSLEQHQDYKLLPSSQKLKISKTHSLVEPQASFNAAKQSAAIDQRLLEVEKTHASTQSCFHCHASQERYSVALRKLQGQGSREFGYLFRAFGYVGPTPYMNRRFIHEVNSVTQKLNQSYLHQ